ncbi:MAG: penicillin-binding protein, partial [Xanthobacteraceae bacterium]|nr:penicillin-binding protein [Xanthobacteraceae bacterium]
SIPNWPAAGKTGTSQDYRDAWFVGYTGALVTGVWIGNDDSSPTRRASGANLPVDVWNKFMRTAHQNLPPVELPGSGQRYQDGPLVPPADVRNDEPQTDRQADRGIDGWFLDRLFGIRRN